MKMSDRVCVIGAKGMLGRELIRACEMSGGRLEYNALDVEEIDIANAESTAAVFERLRPRLVINAAAYTNVDGCETERELAMAVNARGPENLARCCRTRGARLVHVSSDYVFDGTKRAPYLPDDPVNPQSVYGQSKAEGDRGVRNRLEDHVIVRSSWLYAAHGTNFVRTMLRLAGERSELRVVNDQIGCPTYARDLAGALLLLGLGTWRGTFHFCNAGACSWHEFASEILRLAGSEVPVLPMTTGELNRPAPRPAYSVLGTDRFAEHTGVRPRAWRDALVECLREMGRLAC